MRRGLPVKLALKTRTRLALARGLSRAIVLGRRALGKTATVIAKGRGLWREPDLALAKCAGPEGLVILPRIGSLAAFRLLVALEKVESQTGSAPHA